MQEIKKPKVKDFKASYLSEYNPQIMLWSVPWINTTTLNQTISIQS